MQDVGATCDSISDRAKQEYKRTRPFVYYNQQTLVPEQEESHINNGSYPSGHTVLGWTMALLLSDINPAVADQLLARGYEYGQSRVIAGYHWQSDVDAGRLGGSVLYAKLQGNPRFREQLAKAQQEFNQLTGGTSGVAKNTISTSIGTSQAFTISGIPATSETRGIIIQNGKKIIAPTPVQVRVSTLIVSISNAIMYSATTLKRKTFFDTILTILLEFSCIIQNNVFTLRH